MTLLQGAFLGLLQGLTEFLPISSSGHLALFEILFGFEETNLFFNIMLHLGTLVAVVIFFWKDLCQLTIDTVLGLGCLVRGQSWKEIDQKHPLLKLTFLILLATIPTGLMGVLLKDTFESMFSSLRAVGIAFWITTLLVLMTKWIPLGSLRPEKIGFFRALCIGVAQGIAITPGISRSGSTISIALLLGMDRIAAARFSFLISIPAILGASLLEFKDLDLAAVSAGSMAPTLAGAVAAAVVGYLCIKFLIHLLVRGSFHWFAIYTFLLGGLTLFLSY